MRFFLLILMLFLSSQAGAVPQWTCKGKECDEDQRFTSAHEESHEDVTAVRPVVTASTSQRQAPKQINVQKKAKKKAQIVSQAAKEVLSPEPSGNLPLALLARNLTGFQLEGKPTLVSSHETIEKLEGVQTGDIVHALIEQAITASPSLSSPIRAELLDSKAKGSILVGEATLDQELKRVILQFHKIRDAQSNILYELKASGLSPSGELGLVGEYHSQDGKFFLAQLFSAGLAGFTDATINREKNISGNIVETPGVDTAAKQGLVSALSQTSQRMADRAKNAPEYTHTDGYRIIPILITEGPIKRGN